MSANQCDIGLIGLAVMGENLVLNMESKGFSVAVFNRTTEVTDKFAATRAKGKNIRPTRTIEEFIGALKKPRKAQIMIKAGKPVDQVIGEIAPFMEKGDVIIDGGNSLFTDLFFVQCNEALSCPHETHFHRGLRDTQHFSGLPDT